MYDIRSYTHANSIQEAVEILSQNSNALLIAGGTDVLIKARELKSGYVGRDLVGISGIKELKEIKFDENGDILIGAGAIFSVIEKNPIILKHIPTLATAVGMVGGPQIRNVATIGGNICNGATSADSASTLFASDAILVIQNIGGKKELPIDEFYISAGKVKLDQGDILTHIKIKKENFSGFKGHYIKFAQRKAMDIATIGCALFLKQREGKIKELKIAFGVAGPTPLRAKTAESFAKGKEINESNLTQICALCLNDTKARDSWRASKAFRENLIVELPMKALKVILGEQNV